MSSNDSAREWTRRAVLAVGTTSSLTLLAGCSDSTNRATTQPTGAASNTPSTSAGQDATFTSLYTDSFDSDATVLNADQRTQYADPRQFKSTSHLLEALTETVVTTATPESQTLTQHLKHAIHNDLGYSAAEIRVLDRNTARGDSYTAIFHRQGGDWRKDLTLLRQDDHGYRRHDETATEDSRGPGRYLDALWNTNDQITAAATAYPALTAYTWEKAGPDATQQALARISIGNDHIVVDNPRDIAVVGYTIPAATELARLQDITARATFSAEMHIVEAATKTFYSSTAPYIEMQVQDDGVVAVPSDSYRGPESLYLS